MLGAAAGSSVQPAAAAAAAAPAATAAGVRARLRPRRQKDAPLGAQHSQARRRACGSDIGGLSKGGCCGTAAVRAGAATILVAPRAGASVPAAACVLAAALPARPYWR